MPRTVEEAIAYASRDMGAPFPEGTCQKQNRLAYAVPSDGTPSAAADWERSKRRVATTDPAAIPCGALVRWTGGSHGDGHVAISTGDSHCWSTDILRTGHWDHVPIALIEAKWGLRLAGYTRDIDGIVVYQKPVPKPVPPKPKSRGAGVDAAVAALQKAKAEYPLTTHPIRGSLVRRAERLLLRITPA